MSDNGVWTALPGLTCKSGACAQARDLARDDRISERDYREGLCYDHEVLHTLLRAARALLDWADEVAASRGHAVPAYRLNTALRNAITDACGTEAGAQPVDVPTS